MGVSYCDLSAPHGHTLTNISKDFCDEFRSYSAVVTVTMTIPRQACAHGKGAYGAAVVAHIIVDTSSLNVSTKKRGSVALTISSTCRTQHESDLPRQFTRDNDWSWWPSLHKNLRPTFRLDQLSEALRRLYLQHLDPSTLSSIFNCSGNEAPISVS